MSVAGAIRLHWGAEEYAFDLGLDQWRRIQDRCNAGPGEIYRRLIVVAMALQQGLTLAQAAAMGMIGDWRIDDMREVLLQGLIGGGLTEIEAGPIIRRLVDGDRDFKVNLALAYAVAKHGLRDFEDAPPGESTGEAGSPTSPTESSASAGSTTTPA